MNSKADYDYVGAVVDEIALEGLDGITLSALWLRLSNRPQFSIRIDEKSKVFLWKVVAVQSSIEIFQLPEPRSPLVIYNRYDHIDIETGIVVEPTEVGEDIYPMHPIEDGKIRGSCVTYKERTNVTSEIRTDSRVLMSLDDVTKKWGESLVLVATPEQRFLALCGSLCDPTMEINILQYLMLERIGRSRYHGEVTQGKLSLTVMNEPPKKLHYLRKNLLAQNVITKQIHYQRNCSGQMVCGKLLHLTRFYVEKLPKFVLMIQKVCEILAKKPNRTAPMQVLQSELGLKDMSLKKLFQKHDKVVNIVMLPAREVFPDADPKTYVYVNKKERYVKCLQLPEHVDVDMLGKEEEEDDEDADDEPVIPSGVKIACTDRPFLNQVYDEILKIGPAGASFGELKRRLGLPSLDVRLLCRNLERMKVVFKVMKDAGRQRYTLYVARCFENQSEHQLQFLEERRKILEIAKSDTAMTVKDEFDTSKECTEEDTKPIEVEFKYEQMIKDIESQTNISCASVIPSVKMQQVTKSEIVECSFIEEIEKWNTADTLNSSLTLRTLRRANLILNAVRQEKLFDNIYKFQKLIMAEEQKDGYTNIIDKNSVLRIIGKLVKDGYLNSYKTVLQMGNKIKKLHIVCLPEIKENDPIVRSAVDRAKYKYFFCSGIEKIGKTSAVDSKGQVQSSVHDSIQTLLHIFGTPSNTQLEFRPNMGRVYGVEPKCIRMQVLHQLLYYLVYEHKAKSDTENVFMIWEDENDESNVGKVPKKYKDDGTWRMFIPPLPNHAGWSDGWALISDVFLRLPLSLFVKMVNITFKVDKLEEYLRDPIKVHYLIAHVPLAIRSALLYFRRYVFTIATVAEHLAYLGLLSFGPHENKEKDQKFVYIHRNACISDTTSASESYIQLPADETFSEKKYHFKDMSIVEQYWCDLRDICIHTPLGCRKTMQGQEVILEPISKKSQMMEALKPKLPGDIVDDGRLPGDRRGAGGLDSALFSHIKRSWNYNHAWKKKMPSIPTGVVVKGRSYSEEPFYKNYLRENFEDNMKQPAKKRLSRLSSKQRKLKELKSSSKKSEENKELEPKVSMMPNLSTAVRMKGQKRKSKQESNVSKKRIKQDNKIRRIVPSCSVKPRLPYYDEKDRAALRLQNKLRVSWSPQEDSFLLLCRVASMLINPMHNNHIVIRRKDVRDLLAESLSVSRDKTSTACQRRIVYMLKNSQTVYNIAMFFGEAKGDEKILSLLPDDVPKLTDESLVPMFRKVLLALVEKFSSTSNPRGLKSGCTAELKSPEELRKYSLVNMEDILSKPVWKFDVKNVVDVRSSVVRSLIMSSVSCTGDKTNWAYQLYRIYHQYPDSLSQSALRRLRREKMISHRKSYACKRQILPLATTSYQLSITYEHQLMSRYPSEIFRDSNCLMSRFHLAYYQRSTLPSDDLDIVLPSLPSGGENAAVMTLVAAEKLSITVEIPDQIIIFDKDVQPSTSEATKEDEKKETANYKACSRAALYMLRQQIDIKNCNSGNVLGHQDFGGIINLCKVRTRLKDPPTVVPSDDVSGEAVIPDHDYYYAANKTNSPHGLEIEPPVDVCKRILNSQSTYYNDVCPSVQEVCNQFTKGDKDQLVKIYNTILLHREMGTTKKILFAETGNWNNVAELNECLHHLIEFSLVVRVGVNTMRYVATVHCKPWHLRSIQIPHKHKALVPEARQELAKKLRLEKKHAKSMNHETDLTGSTSTENVADMETMPCEPEQLSCKTLATDPEPSSSEAKDDRVVDDHSYTANATDVLSSGTCDQHAKDAEPSTSKDVDAKQIADLPTRASKRKLHETKTSSKDILENVEQKVLFICRQWRKPDGHLNKVILRAHLSSLLSYIMQFPGIEIQKVVDKYVPILQPVHTMELIEILETIGCVTRLLVLSESTTLFSPRPDIRSDEECDFELHNDVAFEATFDCILKLGQFLTYL